ncbi:uncharacterized protein [Lepisosteus oculatus]|uniref:uncharacterized protein n=1 Tax=Lepisosteus oculatus TaxID=7918 RepID=UPI0035F50035
MDLLLRAASSLVPLLSLLAWAPGLGVEGVTLYSTVGGSVNMSCEGSRCHQKYYFEWSFYHKSEPIRILNSKEMITVSEAGRPERLSLGSDWSLHIHSLNTQDTGVYICEQNVNGSFYLPGRTLVYLYLLSISASPSGELKTDTVLTLQCGLDCGDGFQSCPGVPAGVTVTWESDHMDTVDIREDRHFSSLSMKLQSSDHMRNWTCVLRERGVMKTSDTYTIHLTVQLSLAETSLRLTVFIIVLIIPLVIGLIIFNKRRNSKLTEEPASGMELETQR